MDNLELWYRHHKQGAGTVVEGQPPLTFAAKGTPLTEWTIFGADGGVGERTENVFNKNNRGGYYKGSSGEFVLDNRYSYFRIPVNVGDVVRMTNNGRGAGCAFYNGEYVSMISFQTDVYTVPEGVDEISNNYNYIFRDSAMVVVNQQLPNEYVPYGYKIPIVCGGETTNIYIGDSKLYDGDKISYSDTGVEIPTINGINTLTVNTAVQPTKVSISTGDTAIPDSLLKYLQWKYGVKKNAGI